MEGRHKNEWPPQRGKHQLLCCVGKVRAWDYGSHCLGVIPMPPPTAGMAHSRERPLMSSPAERRGGPRWSLKPLWLSNSWEHSHIGRDQCRRQQTRKGGRAAPQWGLYQPHFTPFLTSNKSSFTSLIAFIQCQKCVHDNGILVLYLPWIGTEPGL